ncbi:MAG TPA: UrcA family protein [Steroidobacteraceae bacterium]|jgi:UrcA family protein|nr:UrcA family protein [Steroidobacteraceae bacterium]
MTTAKPHFPSRRRNTVRMATLVGYFVAATAAGVAGAASPATDVPSVVVRYADLDLATDPGVRTLYTRIARAALKVCPDAPIGDLHAVVQARTCQQQAIARAVLDVNRPMLAAVYADHWKRS